MPSLPGYLVAITVAVVGVIVGAKLLRREMLRDRDAARQGRCNRCWVLLEAGDHKVCDACHKDGVW